VDVALARAREAVDDCLNLPAWALRGQELIDCLDQAHALQQKVIALVLRLVREVDRAGLAREQGATSTAAWLRSRLRLSVAAARLLVGDAERLDAGPAAVRAAVAAGAVNGGTGPTAGRQRWITRCCSARSTTGRCTTAVGRSASPPTGAPSSPHRPG
jgi:hypothetical protein